jgi:hypothetical protein
MSDAVGLGYRTLLRWSRRVSGGNPRSPLRGRRRRAAAPGGGPPGNRGPAPRPSPQPRHLRPAGALPVGHLPAQRVGNGRRGTRQAQPRSPQVCKHVTWKEPNLAWAIDATERGRTSRESGSTSTRSRTSAPGTASRPGGRRVQGEAVARIWKNSSRSTGPRSS